MTAKELMIGNILKVGEYVVSVNAICADRFTCLNKASVILNSIQYKFSGIPLTPEWLERFGAERIDHRSFSIPINNGWSIVWETNNYIYLKYLDNECEVSHVEFKYVHQLQNLYFALTGEELTLKQ